jgi:hypothetical protein
VGARLDRRETRRQKHHCKRRSTSKRPGPCPIFISSATVHATMARSAGKTNGEDDEIERRQRRVSCAWSRSLHLETLMCVAQAFIALIRGRPKGRGEGERGGGADRHALMEVSGHLLGSVFPRQCSPRIGMLVYARPPDTEVKLAHVPRFK